LYVVVQPSGRKSYAVRYRFRGKPCKLTLDADISLADARVAAAEARRKAKRGEDNPAASKQEAKQERRAAEANTFRAIAEEYFSTGGDKKKGGGRNLRSKKWREDALVA
jgi:hypothetical protein